MMSIHLLIVYGCFPTSKAELISCEKDYTVFKAKIFTPWLFIKKKNCQFLFKSIGRSFRNQKMEILLLCMGLCKGPSLILGISYTTSAIYYYS